MSIRIPAQLTGIQDRAPGMVVSSGLIRKHLYVAAYLCKDEYKVIAYGKENWENRMGERPTFLDTFLFSLNVSLSQL